MPLVGVEERDDRGPCGGRRGAFSGELADAGPVEVVEGPDPVGGQDPEAEVLVEEPVETGRLCGAGGGLGGAGVVVGVRHTHTMKALPGFVNASVPRNLRLRG